MPRAAQRRAQAKQAQVPGGEEGQAPQPGRPQEGEESQRQESGLEEVVPPQQVQVQQEWAVGLREDPAQRAQQQPAGHREQSPPQQVPEGRPVLLPLLRPQTGRGGLRWPGAEPALQGEGGQGEDRYSEQGKEDHAAYSLPSTVRSISRSWAR